MIKQNTIKNDLKLKIKQYDQETQLNPESMSKILFHSFAIKFQNMFLLEFSLMLVFHIFIIAHVLVAQDIRIDELDKFNTISFWLLGPLSFVILKLKFDE